MIDHADMERLTDEVARRVRARLSRPDTAGKIIVPVGVSARHLHLTREVLESLFGKGYDLRLLRPLSQPGEFAAQEAVTIVGKSGRAIESVRILGPLQPFTQIELARSDGIRLGLDLPVRKTDDLAGTPGLTVVGPVGTIVLKQGAIRATRHIRMSKDDARGFGLADGQVVKVRIAGSRAVTFENVIIRASEGFVLDFRIDTDDANAAGVETDCFGEVLP